MKQIYAVVKYWSDCILSVYLTFDEEDAKRMNVRDYDDCIHTNVEIHELDSAEMSKEIFEMIKD